MLATKDIYKDERTCKKSVATWMIEVDPEKVKAILEMPEPRTERQVRGFLGRLNYIAWFISQFTAICEPLFKLLCKNQTVCWNEDCQEVFGRIKQCLMNP